MNNSYATQVALVEEALNSFLQTLLGSEAAARHTTSEEVEPEHLEAEVSGGVGVWGQGPDSIQFGIILNESWLPLLSQAMLGEAMTLESDGVDDLMKELAAQAYGSIRSHLAGNGTKIPEVNFLFTKPGEPIAAMPGQLIKTSFQLEARGDNHEGFVILPIQAPPAKTQPTAAPRAAQAAAAPPSRPQKPVQVAPAMFPELGNESNTGHLDMNSFDLLAEVELEVTVELGRRRLPLADVLRLTIGSVIELEKLVGEPLEIYANNRLIAEGEAVVIDEQFGIRVTNLVSKKTAERAVY